MDIHLIEVANPLKSISDIKAVNATYDNCFRIVYVEEGEASYSVNGKDYTIPQGHYAILDDTAICDTSNAQVISIVFIAEFLNRSYSDITTIHQLYNEFTSKSGYTVEEKSVYHSFPCDSIYDRIEFITSEVQNRSFGYEKCIIGAISEIIVMTIRNISIVENEDKTKELIVERIISEIENHYNENIQLCQFAEEFGYSVSYLSECFKTYTGQTFSEYLKKIRMKAAHKLIIESPEKSIEQIAREVGYTDIKFFTSTFKKTIGITPKEDVEILRNIRV